MAKTRKTEIDADAIPNIVIEAPPPKKVEVKEEEKKERRRPFPLKLVFISSGIILFFIIITGAGFYFLQDRKITVKVKVPMPAPEPEQKLTYSEYSLGTFFFPLSFSNSKEDLFLKLDINVWADKKEVIAEIEENAFFLRDKLYTLLKNKKLDDIDAKGARERLNKEVLTQINNVLQSGRVDKVLFTEFFIM